MLGGAAALATAASAQAADLPVKAAPVEYVKVCSLYGAGFFFIPGTDTCLKIGGYLRSDHIYGMASAGGTTCPRRPRKRRGPVVTRTRSAPV